MTEKHHPRTIDIILPGDEDWPHSTRPTDMPADVEEVVEESESKEGEEIDSSERRRPYHGREHYIDIYAPDYKPPCHDKRVVNNIDIEDMRVTVH